jgi:DNA-binding NtrC family response regulator
MQQLACDVHAASGFAARRLTIASATQFPADMLAFQAHWRQLLAGAMGGSLFISSVEAIPPCVQELLSHALHLMSLQQLPVRVISGTTQPLFSEVARGHFSEALYYRLNVIHLHADPAAVV